MNVCRELARCRETKQLFPIPALQCGVPALKLALPQPWHAVKDRSRVYRSYAAHQRASNLCVSMLSAYSQARGRRGRCNQAAIPERLPQVCPLVLVVACVVPHAGDVGLACLGSFYWRKLCGKA